MSVGVLCFQGCESCNSEEEPKIEQPTDQELVKTEFGNVGVLKPSDADDGGKDHK